MQYKPSLIPVYLFQRELGKVSVDFHLSSFNSSTLRMPVLKKEQARDMGDASVSKILIYLYVKMFALCGLTKCLSNILFYHYKQTMEVYNIDKT